MMSPPTDSTHLVFSSLGKNHRAYSWNRGSSAFDVALAYFESDIDSSLPEARYTVRSKGYKFANFLMASRRFPAILEYDYVMFIDDDIVISPMAVETTFATARERGLDVCQPSLSTASQASWSHTRQRSELAVEYCNLVEIQCFCVSRRLLELMLPHLPQVETGWGLDLILWELLGRPTDRMAILHSLSMFHPPRREGRIHTRIRDFQSRARNVEIALSRSIGLGDKPLLPFELLGFASVPREPTAPFPAYELTTQERRLFESVVKGAKRYLEYGSGNSTVVAAELAESVTTVEHSADYAEQIRQRGLPNVRVEYRAPNRPHRAFHRFGSDWNAINLDQFIRKDGRFEVFRSYVRAPTGPPYDVVLIDGRARVSCAQHLIAKRLVSRDSLVLVHDYDRRGYHMIEAWFDLVQIIDRMALLVPRLPDHPAR